MCKKKWINAHQQAQRGILVEVMEVGHQGEVPYPAPFHHAGDGIPNALRVSFDTEEVEGYVQAIGGVGDQLQVADLGDVEVAQHATQLEWK